MNFAELRSTFEGLLKRRDLTSTQRDSWLNAAIDDVEDLVKVPPMIATVVTPMQAEFNGTLPIPSDYLKLHNITVGSCVLRKKSLETVLALRACGVGTPTIFCERGQSWWFAPVPGTDTEFQIDYYQEIPHLSAADDENWLSNVKPYAIIDGALVRAARHFVDRRLPDFVQAFTDELQTMQARSDDDALTDGVLPGGAVYPEDF